MKKTLQELKKSLSTTKTRIICLEDEMAIKVKDFEKLVGFKMVLEAEIEEREPN